MINTIIKNYFSITGRPVATMTVEEYLSFYSFINSQRINTPITEIPSLISNETHNIKPNPPANTLEDTQNKEKQAVQGGALALLKSVSG